MEAILLIFFLFVLGIAAYFLLSAALTVGVFAAMGLIVLLMLATCVEISEREESGKHEVQNKEEKKRQNTTNASESN